jgi:hypothetical protein
VGLNLNFRGDKSRRTTVVPGTAGLHFCLSSENCTEIMKISSGEEDYTNTAFITKMSVKRANSSVILDLKNGSIIDVLSIGERQSSVVNLGEFSSYVHSAVRLSPGKRNACTSNGLFARPNSSQLDPPWVKRLGAEKRHVALEFVTMDISL